MPLYFGLQTSTVMAGMQSKFSMPALSNIKSTS